MALDWSQCPAVESVPGKVSGAWMLRGTRMPVGVGGRIHDTFYNFCRKGCVSEGGVLWQGRFFDRALRTVKEYHEKVEYIHLNPVKRGLVHRSISPLYFTTAGNLSAISPEGAKENSPGRKPWENVRPLSPEPRRGDRIWANLAASFAPTGAPGEKNRKTFPFSQGLRPGLLSAALRAKENNIMNQSNDVLAV